jgi:hypothetical protein
MECYLLNTDARSMANGKSPHERWFKHGMAFCAEDTLGILGHKGESYYGDNFSKLRQGDICLMYVNGTGVIGYGEVLEDYDGISYSEDECLVYGPGSNGYGTEHRIEVDWKDLRNSEKGPIRYNELMSMNILPNKAFKRIVASKQEILELVFNR